MKRKYQIGFILLFLLTGLCAFSQIKPDNISVTLDLGGNSGAYSLNGEYGFLHHKHFKLNARLGFGYLPVYESNFLSVPIGITVLTGNKKHHIEIGVGASYIKGLSFTTLDIENETNYYASEALYFVPSIGYRYDKLSGGLILKVYYSPLIVIRNFFDKDKIINDVVGDSYLSGNYFADKYYPTATNKYGYMGISVGYRF